MKLPKLQAAIIRTLIVLLVVFAPYVFSRLMSPLRVLEQHNLQSNNLEVSEKPTLTIAAYNIAHGRGTANSNSAGGDSEERIQRLENIGKLLKQIDADVVILNEVDFDSSWSYDVNQAAFLAKAAGYPYWVEQRNLDFRFLWKTWRFGNAILSKTPLSEPKLVKLPAYSFWEPILAGKKQAVSATLEHNGQSIRVIAAHLSHRSPSLRRDSADMILDQISRDKIPTVLAGDMNSMPLYMIDPDADHFPETAIQVFGSSARFRIPTLEYPLNKSDMTFHSEDPKWMIDWILIPEDWSFRNYSIEDITLSDHRLIHAEISKLQQQN